MLSQPWPVRRTRLPMPTIEGLLVAASTALVYLVALKVNLVDTLLQPLYAYEFLGVQRIV